MGLDEMGINLCDGGGGVCVCVCVLVVCNLKRHAFTWKRRVSSLVLT